MGQPGSISPGGGRRQYWPKASIFWLIGITVVGLSLHNFPETSAAVTKFRSYDTSAEQYYEDRTLRKPGAKGLPSNGFSSRSGLPAQMATNDDSGEAHDLVFHRRRKNGKRKRIRLKVIKRVIPSTLTPSESEDVGPNPNPLDLSDLSSSGSAYNPVSGTPVPTEAPAESMSVSVSEGERPLWSINNLGGTGHHRKPQDIQVFQADNGSNQSKPLRMSQQVLQALLREPDLQEGASASQYINNSIPISSDIRNALLELKSLHPLLDSESLLGQGLKVLPENKTRVIDNKLRDTIAQTPLTPDLKSAKVKLRRKHPLLNTDSLISGYESTIGKVSPDAFGASGSSAPGPFESNLEVTHPASTYKTTIFTSPTPTPNPLTSTTTSTKQPRRRTTFKLTTSTTTTTTASPVEELRTQESFYTTQFGGSQTGQTFPNFQTSTPIPETTLIPDRNPSGAETSGQRPPVILFPPDPRDGAEVTPSTAKKRRPRPHTTSKSQLIVTELFPETTTGHAQLVRPLQSPNRIPTSSSPNPIDESTNNLFDLLNLLQQPNLGLGSSQGQNHQQGQGLFGLSSSTPTNSQLPSPGFGSPSSSSGTETDLEKIIQQALLESLLGGGGAGGAPGTQDLFGQNIFGGGGGGLGQGGLGSNLFTTQNPNSNNGKGLSNSDLRSIYSIIENQASSSPPPAAITPTTPRPRTVPTTTNLPLTTGTPSLQEALSNMLSVLSNPFSSRPAGLGSGLGGGGSNLFTSLFPGASLINTTPILPEPPTTPPTTTKGPVYKPPLTTEGSSTSTRRPTKPPTTTPRPPPPPPPSPTPTPDLLSQLLQIGVNLDQTSGRQTPVRSTPAPFDLSSLFGTPSTNTNNFNNNNWLNSLLGPTPATTTQNPLLSLSALLGGGNNNNLFGGGVSTTPFPTFDLQSLLNGNWLNGIGKNNNNNIFNNGPLLSPSATNQRPNIATQSQSQPQNNNLIPQGQPKARAPPNGPYFWLDLNAFLGGNRADGPLSGLRPKIGLKDPFIKVS